MAPRFRADQIGSLLRPQYLLDAQHAVCEEGSMHTTYKKDATQQQTKAYENAVRKSIKDIVNEQLQRGVVPITDGEFGRSSFISGFFEKLEGIEIRNVDFKKEYRTNFPVAKVYASSGKTGRDTPIATGKVKWTKSTYMDDWLYIRSLVPQEKWKDVKMTVPTPNWTHTQVKDGTAYDKGVYGSDEEYLDDVGEAVRQEILALYGAGVRFIQIDDPMVGMVCDAEYLETQKKEGNDIDKLLDPAIRAHRAASRDMPDDLTLAVHLCRGNLPKDVQVAVGSYENIAPRLFRETHYKRFSLEYDNEEVTGSFALLEHLPKDAVVVLGIVTTKDPELESVADMESKVQNAAGIIAKGQGRSREEVLKENLALSPSCGFASLSAVHGVDEVDVQWKKLDLVKRVAEKALGGSD